MPGPIDDALKHLTELSPQDWVVRGGWPAAAAALINADIGTISGATDKVIKVASTPVSFRWPRWAMCRKPICPRSWPR